MKNARPESNISYKNKVLMIYRLRCTACRGRIFLNSNIQNDSVEEDSCRTAEVRGELREILSRIGKLSAVLQVTATINFFTKIRNTEQLFGESLTPAPSSLLFDNSIKKYKLKSE
jgi:hypothetical protein